MAAAAIQGTAVDAPLRVTAAEGLPRAMGATRHPAATDLPVGADRMVVEDRTVAAVRTVAAGVAAIAKRDSRRFPLDGKG